MTVSPHILIDQDLDELRHASCPEGYELLVQRHITCFFADHAITLAEFDHYCKRLNAIVANRPRSAA